MNRRHALNWIKCFFLFHDYEVLFEEVEVWRGLTTKIISGFQCRRCGKGRTFS